MQLREVGSVQSYAPDVQGKPLERPGQVRGERVDQESQAQPPRERCEPLQGGEDDELRLHDRVP